MNLLHSPNSIPAWQIERANRLHRACLRVQGSLARGEKLTTVLRKVSRYYHRRVLRSAPSRKLQLTPPTLRRWFENWKLGGKAPTALKLKYRIRCPFMPRPLLIRFAEFCATRRLPSVRVAWLKFSATGQNGRAREFSYQQVIYAFDSANFYLMQAQLKASEKAQAKLDQVRSQAIAKITSRLSERPPRRRANLADAFEI